MPGKRLTVNKLRVSSDSEERLASHLQRLQDAFRCASLPGLPAHGIVFIRRLELPGVAANASAMKLSTCIDEQVRQLAATAVCVNQHEQSHANVVWFSDLVTAKQSLLSHYFKGSTPHAWYWKHVLPSWQPGIRVTQVLQQLLQQECCVYGHSYHAHDWVQQCIDENQTSLVLNVLSPRFAIQQLTGFGLYPLDTKQLNNFQQSSCVEVGVADQWKPLLQTALTAFGAQACRTRLIACWALLKHNPCFLLMPSSTCHRYIEALIKQSKQTAHAFSEEPARTSNILPGQAGAPVTHVDIDDALPFIAQPPHAPVQQDKQAIPAQTQYEQVSDTINSAKQSDDIGKDIDSTGFVHSQYAGLGFLFSVMEYCDMENLLKLNPELAQLNLPVLLLKRVMQSLAIDDNHPFSTLFTDANLDESSIDRFVSPPGWARWLYQGNAFQCRKYCYSVAGDKGDCMIMDTHKKSVLYLGQRQAIPEYLLNGLIYTQRSVNRLDQAALLNSLLCVYATYVWRFARRSSRSIVHQPGRIAITGTHIDIIFASDQVAIEIRRAGLDIDPGWLAWLGRVVMFHYNFDRQQHV